jgi:hypothetical protein
MFPHQSRQAGLDHGLADRLENMDQLDVASDAFGNQASSIGDPTTHGGQVDARNYGWRHPSPCSTSATLLSPQRL